MALVTPRPFIVNDKCHKNLFFWGTLPESFLHNTIKIQFYCSIYLLHSSKLKCNFMSDSSLFLPCLLPDYARIIIHVDDTSLPRQIGNKECKENTSCMNFNN